MAKLKQDKYINKVLQSVSAEWSIAYSLDVSNYLAFFLLVTK
jgi:hypothetical protein